MNKNNERVLRRELAAETARANELNEKLEQLMRDTRAALGAELHRAEWHRERIAALERKVAGHAEVQQLLEAYVVALALAAARLTGPAPGAIKRFEVRVTDRALKDALGCWEVSLSRMQDEPRGVVFQFCRRAQDDAREMAAVCRERCEGELIGADGEEEDETRDGF